MSDITISLITDPRRASEIHQVLCLAFEPYREFYTLQAFADTVRTPGVFEQRIASPDIDVLAAETNDEVVGTVCARVIGDGELYFFSMAVKPEVSGVGTGRLLLEKLEAIARDRNCRAISLETCYFLSKAIGLYERFGFVGTGKERDYGGNVVFEMRKDLPE